jgi:hypothetical protein
MMRIAAYAEVGGVRAAFSGGAEDYDLWLRLAQRYHMGNVTETVTYYRVHPGQASQIRSKQLILSTVGAQLAALRRQADRPDCLDSRTAINYAALLELESDKEVVDNALLLAAAGHATFLALVGKSKSALDLLNWAEQAARGSALQRDARARAQLVRAILAWKHRDAAGVCTAALRALALNPPLVARLVGKGVSGSIRLISHRLESVRRGSSVRMHRVA